MNRLRIVIASVFAVSAIGLVAPPASAGLWCEQADEIDESVTGTPSAGAACRTVLGTVCTVVTKDPGCLQ